MKQRTRAALRGRATVSGIIASVAAVTAVTAAVYVFRGSVPVLSLGVLYVFAVLPVAVVWGHALSIPVAVASMLTFNFLFLPPVHTLTLIDRRDWLALTVYLATAVVVSDLAARARRRATEAEQREREATALADVSLALLRSEGAEIELHPVEAAAARALGVDHVRLELGRTPSAGRARPLELSAGGRTVGFLEVGQDGGVDSAVVSRFLPALASLLAVAVDRERLREEALEAARLRMSDSVKTAILRAVSHDLRSPLTAIRVAAESIASPSVRLDARDRARQLDTVRRESARLDRLVADLLDLSRLEAGATVSRRELVEADELAGRAAAAAGGEERVRVECPPTSAVVDVDVVQVERALVNLLENALRYSPPSAEVVVRVAAECDDVVITVMDAGPGVPADERERIFEPFHQLAREGGGRGTGLGLAIARGFAEASGGRVWVDAAPTGGASFALAFPRVPVAMPAGA